MQLKGRYETDRPHSAYTCDSFKATFWGSLFVLCGLLLLLANFGLLSLGWDILVPVLLISLGVAGLIRALRWRA